MKKLGILLITGFLIVGNSCQNYLEDVNVNPNNATDASLANMMTSAMVTFLGVNEGSDARMAGMWSQQFTGSDRQYAGIGAYQVNTGDFDFFQPYIGILTTADLAIGKAEELGSVQSAGVMKVIMGATYGYLASVFGDVPFSEALKVDEFPNPHYDNQIDVYNGAIALLNEGITDLGGTGGIAADIFGLTADQWIEVAHTYMARFYLHIGDYTNALAAANKGISSSANNLIGTHGTAKGGDRNMWYDFMVDERGGYLTAHDAYLPLIMDPTSPMYSVVGGANEQARFDFYYTGVYNATASIYEPNVADGGMFGMTSPYPLITYIENQLIIAEAQLELNPLNTAEALTALNNVRAELDSRFGTGDGSTYPALTMGDFADTNALKKEIYTEKYKSLMGQTEAWCDLVRNKLYEPQWFNMTPIQGTQFPERFLYPQEEVNANENVPDPLPGLFDPLRANGGNN